MSVKIRPDGFYDPEGKYPNPLTQQPYSKNYTKLSLDKDPKGWSYLKAYEDRNLIMKKIHNNKILLVILPTGTGKTVVIPRLLYHYFGYQKKIIVTTPRQATTESCAIFAAECFDVPIFELDENGKKLINPDKDIKESRYPTGTKIVSFRHGGNKTNVDNTTQLLFATDGTIKGMITGNDPNLEQYGGIVIDEVHERSLDIDTLISLVMNILLRRPDFKIIFMSATMDSRIFEDYFKRLGYGKDYDIYTVEGAKTTYKIDFIHNTIPEKKDSNKIKDSVTKKINSIMLDFEKKNEIGDIIAFVSSESDTQKIKKDINKNIKNYSETNKPYVITLTRQTKPDELNIAVTKGSLKNIQPTSDAPKGYRRKIIIATPVAESSITFGDPLTFVIDTGLAYTTRYDPTRYCDVNGKKYTTQANILQRCGRTGRNVNGTCYQLYTDSEFKSLPKFTQPEILNKDFTTNLLSLSRIPINEDNVIKAMIFSQNMIEPKANFHSFLKVAFNNLNDLNLINKKGDVSMLGNICGTFGLFDVKIAKLIIGGWYFKCIDYSIMLGAILNSITSLDDMFTSLSFDDEKNVEIKTKYDKNKLNYIIPESDHITLINIVHDFLSNGSSFEYAKKKYLNFSNLTKIQKDINDLYTLINKENIVTRMNKLTEMESLNQFNVQNYYAKGGKINTLLYSKDKLKKLSKTKPSKNISLENGPRIYDNRYFQNNIPNSTLFNRSIKNGGRFSYYNSNYKKPYSTKRNKGMSNSITNTKFTKTLTYKNLTNNNPINLFGGTSPINKVDKKRKHYMELFNLRNFGASNKILKLSSKDELSNRIIASLYYGYSLNIACSVGNNKEYTVKYSKLNGKFVDDKFNKSCYDHIKKELPDFVIYNQFELGHKFGIEDKIGTLKLITKLDPNKHLSYFFNLENLKTQVMEK